MQLSCCSATRSASYATLSLTQLVRQTVNEKNQPVKRNVEIKARISNLELLTDRVRSISDRAPEIIDQEDTFFFCPEGRLKLRKFSDSKGELIYYERPDSDDPTECQYLLSSTSEPEIVSQILSRALGIRGVVLKRRTLYIIGQTRIHLDDVEELGNFVELEVVLQPDQGTADGIRIAEDLIKQLGIAKGHLVDSAYIDLLQSSTR